MTWIFLDAQFWTCSLTEDEISNLYFVFCWFSYVSMKTESLCLTLNRFLGYIPINKLAILSGEMRRSSQRMCDLIFRLVLGEMLVHRSVLNTLTGVDIKKRTRASILYCVLKGPMTHLSSFLFRPGCIISVFFVWMTQHIVCTWWIQSATPTQKHLPPC